MKTLGGGMQQKQDQEALYWVHPQAQPVCVRRATLGPKAAGSSDVLVKM